ncbi:spore gernimation protein GerPD [Brevibacillus ginsengisoli]|uniref:spore gernimation protein GerPD n=1 Tax=Brevibacillus ginsengisoli TaxID=363854 RepID=UPI003CF8813F
MRYQVINGELSIGKITITSVASSSTVLVGDTRNIALSAIFEGPPESLIIGVTTLPPALPIPPQVPL